ncbi:alpha/beta hydrolase [Tomitella fengzijianii]|uniref:Monoacylglycerol lipase n=1 Tax=Tomitella fengzijianii TaxID=2597660 RepID=A0A516X540_9ACTN|nr:alpha/beta hydrolase [Tomitella fengzijianii]QDQ98133.1 lysophospholipase [Tomitella fengzijianii]
MATPVREDEGTITGVGGVELYWRSWTPTAAPPKGLVVLVHGMGEHCGRYDHVADALLARGYAVAAHDHRGHGRSGGKRSFIDRMDNLVADIGTAFDRARAAVPDVPVVMVGHSMGGLSSALWAVDNQDRLAGLVLSGPLAAMDQANAVTKAVARALSAAVPTMGMVAVESDALSHDPTVGEDYRQDPLVFSGKLPARTAAELMTAVDAVQRRAPELRLPLLILHGELDTLAPPRGSQELFEKAVSTDKHRTVYDGMYHEIFNEVDREKVLAELTAWIDAHMV